MNDVAFKADGDVMEREHHLAPLIISRKRFAYAEKTTYRVYKAAAEFVLIEADSAHEAIQKSGVGAPLRVQREMVSRYHALESQLVQTHADDIPAVTDVVMPESSEVVGLVYQGMFDGSEDKAVIAFEGMSFADLKRKEKPKAVPVEDAPAPAPVVQSAPEYVAEPAAIEEESDVLTPEEVERLLNG